MSTLVLISDAKSLANLAHVKDAAGRSGARAARGGGGLLPHLSTPAGSANTCGQYQDRSAGVPAGLGQAGAADARSLAKSQDARAGVEGWRSVAAARAAVERRKVSASLSWFAARCALTITPRRCARRRDRN